MKKTYFAWWVLLLFFAACQDDNRKDYDYDKTGLETNQEQLIGKYTYKGVVRIKLKEDFLESFHPVTTRSGTVSTGLPELDQVARALKVSSMTRTFPYNSKYDVRHRKAGLHLWYNVTFDESTPVTRALENIENIQGVEQVEPVREIVQTGGTSEVITLIESLKKRANGKNKTSDPAVYNDYFNDPLLDLQWHYNNEGLLEGSRQGADINLFAAWETETGKPDVIVAIVDGGIQYDHPDLAANMWINEAELNGSTGVDDDGNGYADDIYGYNFVTNEGTITPHSHGTHVAGTVGAVNNNGIGVAGVAGGDGTPGSGIRLMSCQIFAMIGGFDYGSPNPAEGIVYAADNGAVISQNSWGYEWQEYDQRLSESDKAAIDYFINYAGTDESGEFQTGPMKGGIVIFASGNDNIQGISMPGAYEKVLTVSAIGANYKKTNYSNYGSWVDICAPGGEKTIAFPYGYVLSTSPGDDYSFMEGTSMACPHVSGVAALVVSKHGGLGFTNKKLWDRLISGTNNIQRFETQYNIGIGYINAQKALAGKNEIAPDRVYDLVVEKSTFEYVELAWSITPDTDNGVPERYDLVYSPSPIYRVNPTKLPDGAKLLRVRVPEGAVAGEKMTARVTGLDEEQNYYFAVAAVDTDGNYSLSTTIRGGTITANKPPVVEGMPDAIVLKRAEKTTINLNIYDPEGYNWTYTFEPGSAALSGERVKKTSSFILTFDAYAETPGSYHATLTIADEQGTTATLKIPYTIKENQKPVVDQEFKDIVLYNAGVEKNFELGQYISDPDGDELTYRVESGNPAVISVSAASGVLRVMPLAYGSARITVTATDEVNEKTSTSFHVVCRNPEQKIDLYPVPVRPDGTLNIRMGEDVKGSITVCLYNNAGSRVFSQEVAIAPEAPARVDISTLSAGNYRVTVKHKIYEYSKNITKL